MGLYMYLYLSPTVTQEEWEPVYEETLELAKRMQLCNLTSVEHQGSRYHVQKLVEETKSENWGAYWSADGSLSSMHTSESYIIRRNLDEVDFDDSITPDPIMVDHLDYSASVKHFPNVFGGAKFCSYDFAEQLFGIAAVIDARLGGRTYVYGDIDLDNAEDGVRRINKVLEEMGKEPISLPSFLVPEKLVERVVALDIDEDAKLDVFWHIAKAYEMEIPASFRTCFSPEKCLDHILDKENGKFKGRPAYVHDLLGDEGIRTLIDKGLLDDHLYEEIVSEYLHATVYATIGETSIHESCALVAALDPTMKSHCLELFREHPLLVEKHMEEVKETAMKLKELIDKGNYIPDLGGNIVDYFMNMLKASAYDPRDLGPTIISSPYKLHLYAKGNTIVDYIDEMLIEFYSGCLEKAFEGEQYSEFSSSSHSDKVRILLQKTHDIPETLFRKVAAKLEGPDPDYDRYWPFVSHTASQPSHRAILTALTYNDDLYEYARDKAAGRT